LSFVVLAAMVLTVSPTPPPSFAATVTDITAAVQAGTNQPTVTVIPTAS
jgi:hypothetical protein